MCEYILSNGPTRADSLSDQIRAAIKLCPLIKVFAFSGYKSSGKSFYANELFDYIDNSPPRSYDSKTKLTFVINPVTSFAKPLKQTVSNLFDIPSHYFYDSELKDIPVKKYNKTPRQLLQWFGTEVMQTELTRFLGYSDRMLWVNKCILEQLNEYVSLEEVNVCYIVIDDLRFAHEHAALIKYFGRDNVTFIHVINTTVPAFTEEEKSRLHVSETEHESLESDWVIKNNLETVDEELIADIAFVAIM